MTVQTILINGLFVSTVATALLTPIEYFFGLLAAPVADPKKLQVFLSKQRILAEKIGKRKTSAVGSENHNAIDDDQKVDKIFNQLS
jgi:hypothetical protein